MKPEYRYDIVQQSPEWTELRSTRLGGSSAAVFKANGKRPSKLGTGAITAARKIAATVAYGYEYQDAFQSDAMQRGTELEPIARSAYEEETFTTVRECGYIEYGDYLGFSPDGLVGDDGLIEIKCRGAAAFAEYKINRAFSNPKGPVLFVPPADYYQMQYGLFITGRAWCDYVNYHPQGGLIIDRVDRDIDVIKILTEKSLAFVALIENYVELLTESK